MRLDYNYYISEIQVKDIFNSVVLNENFNYLNKLLFYFKGLNVSLFLQNDSLFLDKLAIIIN